jgi:ADP-ribosylglycohydrolase
MCSDDTEHTLLVAQALLSFPENTAAFQRSLAWKLRLWLLGAPAGVGWATLRAIIKLWLGFPPDRSGVFSAGNGPAMRSAIIGAYFAEHRGLRREYVAAATRITHKDPRAETAAVAVAEAASWIVRQSGPLDHFVQQLPHLGRDGEWQRLCQKLGRAWLRGAPVAGFADELGLQKGVTGYAYHSVPVALYAWLRHANDFRAALESALKCGGDTDTVGAIVGALAGLTCGSHGIPEEWIAGIWEWPRSRTVIAQIARRLAEQNRAGTPLGPVHYFWPALVLRNTFFLVIVLSHGFRRLAPYQTLRQVGR